jgi:hypothetical protein
VRRWQNRSGEAISVVTLLSASGHRNGVIEWAMAADVGAAPRRAQIVLSGQLFLTNRAVRLIDRFNAAERET